MVSKECRLVEKAYDLIGNKEGCRGGMIITNVLVTGAKGQLGSDLVDLLKLSGYKVFGMGRSELDITNEEKVNNIVSTIKTRNYYPLCCLYPSRQS